MTEESYDGEAISYYYDLCGNRLEKTERNGVERYTYNSKNQLLSRKSKLENTIYQYDLQGNILKATGIEQKKENQTEIGKDNNNVINCYILGYGVAVGWNQERKGYHAYHLDEQNSTAYLTDEAGTIQNSYQYGAFGDIRNQKENIHNGILYTGQQYDQVSGQYYLRARFYNRVVGRFLQEDVYRGDGLNLYAYCANNPVMYYDPSGYEQDCRDTDTTNNNGTITNNKRTDSIDLPKFYNVTTHGVLVLDDGTQIAFSSGNPIPNYKNYIPSSHAEGKATIYMRENGINKGIIYHNNTMGRAHIVIKCYQYCLRKVLH